MSSADKRVPQIEHTAVPVEGVRSSSVGSQRRTLGGGSSTVGANAARAAYMCMLLRGSVRMALQLLKQRECLLAG